MNWVSYSLLMFCSSVVMYLAVRKASLLNTPTYLTNLAMFAIPVAAYLVIGLSTSVDLGVSLWHGIILVVASLLFAYGGNRASLDAIKVAPNPGYSLVLSKSYVLFTTLVAVVFLNAELSVRKAAAILLIVAFSALILVEPKNAKKVRDKKWVILSFAAFFGWGFLSLSSRYLFDNGVETMAFLVYIFSIVTACIIAVDKVRISRIKATTHEARWYLVLIGICSTSFNLGQFQAIRLAPNIGYVNAINAASIAAVTICAILLFQDELNTRKVIGVFGITAGLILLLL